MTVAGAEQQPRCPVCRVRYRGTTTCSRCGADIAPLMRLLAEAFRLRRAARRALLNGAPTCAGVRAAAAQRLHATPQGRRLEALGRWLATLDDR